jgi:Cu-processing system permease protein
MNKYLSIFRYTFFDVLKSKVLYISMGLSLITLFVTLISSTYSLGVPGKVSFDVGVGFLDISGLVLALAMGAMYLKKELETKSLHLILARPVSKSGFYLSQILALSSVLMVNLLIILLSVVFCDFLYGAQNLESILLTAFLLYIKMMLVLALCQLFSLFLSKSINVFVTICLYVTGSMVGDKSLIDFIQSGVLSKFVSHYHMVLPGFYRFNIKNAFIYQLDINSLYVFQTVLYGLSYSGFLIFIGAYVFNKKEI